MGAAPSHEETGVGGEATRPVPPPPRRPGLGPRPTNMRHLTPAGPNDTAALPAALFRDSARLPRDLRPIEDIPPIQQSGIVRNVVSLNKTSLKLVRAEQDPSVYVVQFNFDADVEGYITIFYCAKEIVRRAPGSQGRNAPVVKVSYIGKNDELPARTRFGTGHNQTYREKFEKGLDVRKFTASELRYKPETNNYPVVIRLEALYPPTSPIPEPLRVKSQTTFASVNAVDGGYEIQIVAQQVLVRDTIHLVQEMYGIGATDVTAKKDSETSDPEHAYTVDSNHECVICLTEPSNTAVQPCNHLCLCDDCARKLRTETDHHRRKCPVCRTQIKALLRIISAPNRTSDEGNSGTPVRRQTFHSTSTADATNNPSESDTPSPDSDPASSEPLTDATDIGPQLPAETPTQSEERNEGNTVPSPSSAAM